MYLKIDIQSITIYSEYLVNTLFLFNRKSITATLFAAICNDLQHSFAYA